MTINPEDFEELEGSPTFEFSRGSGSATQMFKVAGDKWEQIVAEALPSAFLEGNRVFIPEAYHFPGIKWLICTKVKVEPWESAPLDTTPSTYEFMKLTLSYETHQFDQTETGSTADTPAGASGLTSGGPTDSGAAGQSNEAKTFISWKVSIGGEFLTWPSSSLVYGSKKGKNKGEEGGSDDKVPEDMQLGVVLPLVEHSITWHFVPFPPWAAMRWLVGNVNAYPFAGCPPETLLFHGAEASREIASDGVRMWSLEYKFSYKNMSQLDETLGFGWNYFLRPDGPNAGVFEVINRRHPGGYTTLAQSLAADTPAEVELRLASIEGFDRGDVGGNNGKMFLLVGSELMEVIPVGSGGANSYVPLDPEETLTWPMSVTRAKFSTLQVAHSVGDVVRQVYVSEITNIVKKNRLFVADGTVFPQVGQFFLRIYYSVPAGIADELVVVTKRYQSKPNEFYILRRIRQNLIPGFLVQGCAVMIDCPMYPMGDFRWLFASGLITG